MKLFKQPCSFLWRGSEEQALGCAEQEAEGTGVCVVVCSDVICFPASAASPAGCSGSVLPAQETNAFALCRDLSTSAVLAPLRSTVLSTHCNYFLYPKLQAGYMVTWFTMPGQFKKRSNTILSNNYMGERFLFETSYGRSSFRKEKVKCSSSFSSMYLLIPQKRHSVKSLASFFCQDSFIILPLPDYDRIRFCSSLRQSFLHPDIPPQWHWQQSRWPFNSGTGTGQAPRCCQCWGCNPEAKRNPCVNTNGQNW